MRAWLIACLFATLLAAFLPWLVPLWLVALPVPLLLWRLRQAADSATLFICSLLLTLAMVSVSGQEQLASRLATDCNRSALTLTGKISSLPRLTRVATGQGRQRFEFEVERLLPEDCRGPQTVLLSYYGSQVLVPGERWEFQVTLRRPWGLANPGSFNMQGWYALSGIDAVGSIRGSGERLAHASADLENLHHRVRRHIAMSIDQAGLSQGASAVLKALTVADKSGIDHTLWQLLQQYGINHLLVISGLHVALVAALALLAGRLLRALLQLPLPCVARWPLPEILALLAALLYAALAGFSVATTRALLMLACFLCANMTGRRSSGFNNLLLAAVLVVITNPLVVVGSGFWLSFGAVAGLLWLVAWQPASGIAGIAGKLWRPHLLMSLLMLPAGAFWFGGSSWLSAPANLLMVPLVGWVIVPLALLGAGLSLSGSPAAQWLWHVAAWPVDRLLTPAQLLAAERDLFLTVAADALAVCLALCGLCLGLLPLRNGHRMAVPLLFLPLFFAGQQGDSTPRLSVLDAGQGTAVVFSAGTHTLLYDTGGGDPAGPNIANSVVLPWLHRSGRGALQSLVISHDDLDHSAGAMDILRALPVTDVLVGESLLPDARLCRAGLAWSWPGDIRFQVLSPAAQKTGNDASCVLRIDTPALSILLAGDIGVDQERELIRYWGYALRSDVLLLGHHGSATSTSQSWLNFVAPRIAVVSAGYASRFGHPHADVMARLHQQGIPVRQTALDGAISIEPGRAGQLQVSAHRSGYQPWWM